MVLLTVPIAFFISLAATWVLLRILSRAGMGQTVRADGPESHLKKSGTPTMGGLGFIVATVAGTMLFGAWRSPHVQIVLGAAVLCAALGFADDYMKLRKRKTEGIKARWRFLLEVLIGFGIGYFVTYYYPNPGRLWLPKFLPTLDIGPFIILFTMLVFVGTVNAVNFTDGLDGLLAGSVLPTILVCTLFMETVGFDMGFSGMHQELKMMSMLMFALFGALLAFLWFNAHPARIFMGDTGSLFIGGVLGATAILSRGEIFLFIVGFVFVAEAMSVIIQVASFRLTGQRVFRMAPIHHHFELMGWAETQVVTRFWIVSALCAVAGILLLIGWAD